MNLRICDTSGLTELYQSLGAVKRNQGLIFLDYALALSNPGI